MLLDHVKYRTIIVTILNHIGIKNKRLLKIIK